MTKLWPLLTAVALAGCRFGQHASSLQHDLGRSQNETSPYQWVSVTDDQYYRTQMPFTGLGAGPGQSLQLTSGATQRLQIWVDRIDTMLRTRHGDDFKAVPKPVAKVVLNSSTNAFVAPVPVCLAFKARFAGLPVHGPALPVQPGPEPWLQTGGQPPSVKMLFSRQTGRFQPGTYECLPSTLSREEQLDQLRWQVASVDKCSFEVAGDTVIFSKDCVREVDAPLIQNFANGLPLTVLATSNQLTFFSPIFATFSEPELVSMIAHELGHYYMGHPTTPTAAYNYFYKIGAANPGSKPARDPSLDTLGKHVLDYWTHPPMQIDDTRIQGQQLHLLLAGFFALHAPELASADCGPAAACKKPCSELAQAVAGPLRVATQGLPYYISATSSEPYLQFEALALQCAAQLPYAANGAVINAALLQGYLRSYPDAQLGVWPTATDLKALVLALNGALVKAAADRQELVSKLAESAREIGFYTDEQEADELATEWTDLIGVDPASLTSSMLKFSLAFDQNPLAQAVVFGQVSGERCQKIAQSDWKDDQGHRVLIPVANWLDSHHSFCYRAFNAAREIEVFHEQHFKEHAAKQPDGPSWSELAASVAAAEQAYLAAQPAYPSPPQAPLPQLPSPSPLQPLQVTGSTWVPVF